MPKQNPSGLTKTERGFCRTIGHYLHNEKRVPRKFRLGHDRTLAKQKVEVLEAAWENLPCERGIDLSRVQPVIRLPKLHDNLLGTMTLAFE